MADKDNDNKPQKKSIIASLDLKNYKPKYTDPFGNGKPQAVELDNFLEAEPETKTDIEQPAAPVVKAVPETKRPTLLVDKNNANTKSSLATNKSDNESSIKPEQKTSNKPIQQTKPVLDKPQSAAAVSKPLTKLVTQPKIESVPKKMKSEELKPDSDFERRVSAEAENDFYDEKLTGSIGSTFRSNIKNKQRNDEIEDDSKPDKPERSKRKINLREPVTVNVRHEISDKLEKMEEEAMSNVEERRPPRRVETYGIAISAIALMYSFSIADKAFVFLSLSLFTYLIRPIAALPFGKYGHSVQNALKGFSIALFFGAIFFAFF